MRLAQSEGSPETRWRALSWPQTDGVKSWLHVRRELDVLGRTVKEYVLVGTWYDLPRINETLDALERRLDREGFEQRVAMREV